MKKLLNFILLTWIPITFITQTISCQYNFDENKLLSGFKNFDWSDPKTGEGIDFNPYNENYKISSINNNEKLLNDIKSDNSGNYINYFKFNTGYKWVKDLEKQAVTGVPLNKGFMPNGNHAGDFGITSPAQTYRKLNSILSWSPNVDMDAKYNKSTIKKLSSKFGGAKLLTTQDDRLKFNILTYNSKGPSTFDNTSLGTKNPYEISQLNWQYYNVFVGWAGSWYEGPIIPPPGDNIDFAHKNGAKIFGNIFLDGFHGLTKEMLTDFLKKDENGNFLIVDKLIEIASYMGFDGWYFNNEANGNDPSGTVVNNNDIFEIIKDFNHKTSLSNDENIKNLSIIYYKNNADLYFDESTNKYRDPDLIRMTQSEFKSNDFSKLTELQVNFNVPPGSADHFLDEYKNYNGSNIYTIVDGGWNSFLHGSFDYKNMAYARNKNTQNFDYNNYNSFAGFFDGGSGKFGNAAGDIIGNESSNPLRKYLFMSQVNNLFNDIMIGGTNLFNSVKDEGLTGSTMRRKLDGLDFPTEAVIADPRIHWNKNLEKNDKIRDLIYNYDYKESSFENAGKGYNTFSYGIGDLIREKTILIDENINDTYLKTNFSTGNGIKFIDNDNTSIEDYPWTNRRISDFMPSYKWRLFDIKENNKPLKINEFYGGYDYDEVYRKGNSIVIGEGFDENGSVIPSKNWDTNKTYGWDIFSSNITNQNSTIRFVYKDGLNNENYSKVNLRLSFADKNGNLYEEINDHEFKSAKTTSLKNGWKELEVDLSKESLGINDNKVLSMIGLNIKPNTSTFKFNVGEFSIISNNYKSSEEINYFNIDKVNSEYIVYREFADKLKYNIRFGWDTTNDLLIDYYEIYVNKNGEWFRNGETNLNNYYLRNLDNNDGLTIGIRPVFKDGSKKGEIYKFKINL